MFFKINVWVSTLKLKTAKEKALTLNGGYEVEYN